MPYVWLNIRPILVLQRYEDTELSDLKPLPTPKIVATPDGIANELFGDVAMVLEFIGCYRGLLMPDKSLRIPSAGMSVYYVGVTFHNNNNSNTAFAGEQQLLYTDELCIC